MRPSYLYNGNPYKMIILPYNLLVGKMAEILQTLFLIYFIESKCFRFIWYFIDICS